MNAKPTGILLVNLGTPDDPNPPAVARYLREFLMDPDVIDIPYPLRAFLVHVLIVPRRAPASAEAYRKIWTERGSPLKFHAEDLVAALRARVDDGYRVEFAMRYQNPSLRTGLERLLSAGVERIRVVPLYPQYASASTGSTILAVEREARALGIAPDRLDFVPAFYGAAEFVRAQAALIRDELARGPYDHLFLSYHGLPERQLPKRDPRTARAGAQPDYREQCHATSRLLARELGLADDRWTIGFQSRLGRTKWIEPYSDVLIDRLPERGIRDVVFACPSFVADCLETVEEIGLRMREQFLRAGGRSLRLAPCLNADPRWADALRAIVLAR